MGALPFVTQWECSFLARTRLWDHSLVQPGKEDANRMATGMAIWPHPHSPVPHLMFFDHKPQKQTLANRPELDQAEPSQLGRDKGQKLCCLPFPVSKVKESDWHQQNAVTPFARWERGHSADPETRRADCPQRKSRVLLPKVRRELQGREP